MKLIHLSTAMLVVLTFPSFAQEVGNDDATFDGGIMVTSADVRTCPYRVVQPVSVNVTEDYNADTRGKIFAKFRREAQKAGADAVVLVTRGDKHMTAWAWSRREYTGRAIRYVDRSCAPQGPK
jgi:uncharacterized protein YbjQ (UPF0145 family)